MPYKSDKQRRLMQAVAHSPKFAKKVGIPQSVGQKFEAHKAGGGKVRRISDWLEAIKGSLVSRQHGYDIENSPEYMEILKKADWNPEVPSKDFEAMEQSVFPWHNVQGQQEIGDPLKVNDDLSLLIEKYGMDLPKGTRLYRGLNIMPETADDALILRAFSQGELPREPLLPAIAPQSTSTSPVVAKGYAGQGWGIPMLVRGRTDEGVRALPRVFLSQDEFMLPTDAKFVMDKANFVPGYFPTTVKPGVRKKYAEGGKISGAKELLAKLGEVPERTSQAGTLRNALSDPTFGLMGENSGEYVDLLRRSNFRLPENLDHAYSMLDYAEAPDPEAVAEVAKFAKKYAIDIPPDLPLYRGISLQADAPDAFSQWRPGSVVRLSPMREFAGPVTPRLSVATEFSGLFDNGRDRNLLATIHRNDPVKAFPMPFSGQDELVLLPGQAMVRDIYSDLAKYANQYRANIDFRPGVRKKYAEGGQTTPGKWGEVAAKLGSPKAADLRKRLIAGLASQVMGTDPNTGDIGFRLGSTRVGSDKEGMPTFNTWRPGIVDETLSLGALLPDDVAPQWAKDAQTRTDALHAKIREQMGLTEPKGFEENFDESLGVMLGQIPVPGQLIKRGAKVGREAVNVAKLAAESPMEFLLPTVKPSAENYVSGALFGGGSQGLVDYLTALDQEHDAADEQLKDAYADGGKVSGSAAVQTIDKGIARLTGDEELPLEIEDLADLIE